ncbi:hypothetical protein ACRQ5Q_07865 [Bradyrhizobium sp. PMVTL-01]|uniref:hypothetical protein n=1 Tax=Bradyrhizobium sp. PMVTL-01 TaxID=3434999 RepID=UPI003F710B80
MEPHVISPAADQSKKPTLEDKVLREAQLDFYEYMDLGDEWSVSNGYDRHDIAGGHPSPGNACASACSNCLTDVLLARHPHHFT